MKKKGSLNQFGIEDVTLKAQPASDWSILEDQICALGLHRYGYGFWELIRNDIRNHSGLMFNWVARSRSNFDVQKRCDTLVQQFMKEVMPENKAVSKKDKPKSLLGKRKRANDDSSSLEDKPKKDT